MLIKRFEYPFLKLINLDELNNLCKSMENKLTRISEMQINMMISTFQQSISCQLSMWTIISIAEWKKQKQKNIYEYTIRIIVTSSFD